MKTIYFTITGTSHYHGSEFMKENMEVILEKDTKNEYDKEAIKVKMKGIDVVGYVANSTYSVLGESMSAGRIYDKIGDMALGKILYVLPKGVICELNPKTVINYEMPKEEAEYSDDDLED